MLCLVETNLKIEYTVDRNNDLLVTLFAGSVRPNVNRESTLNKAHKVAVLRIRKVSLNMRI